MDLTSSKGARRIRRRNLSASCMLLVCTLLVSCDVQTQPRSVTKNSQPVANASASPCDQLDQVRKLPFKGEPVDDPAYNEIMNAGPEALPCLIEKVSDTKEMPDPRQSPTVSSFKVGDLAYFMFVRITKLDFVALLPPEVQQAYATDGVYAYFGFVEKPENRTILKDSMTKWYRENYVGRR